MPDPRTRVEQAGGVFRVLGVRCCDCGYPVPFERPYCPACGGDVAQAHFGPDGVVWSSTTVRIAVGDRLPPYRLAYVDLDDGPRVLAHIWPPDDPNPQVGARARIRGLNDDGDLTVEVITG